MRAPEFPAVFSRAQALAMGVGDVRLAGLVRRGQVVRLRPGMYALPEPSAVPPKDRGAWHVECARAALSHHASGFVASHLTGAAVHGLPLPLRFAGPVHMTAVDATQRSRTAPGVCVHHADSGPTDVVVVDGVPTTSVARTVADCLRCWGPRTAVPIADAALRRRQLLPEDIEEQLDRQRRWVGRPRALASLRLVDGRRESWLESYAYVIFDEWGVPLPEPQVWVHDTDGHALGRVDGAWLDDATVLELDGRTKYGGPEGTVAGPWAVWAAEKSRYDDMGNLGLERVRLSLDDLLRRLHLAHESIRRRRLVGSRERFTGFFRLTDPTGLRCLSVLGGQG